MVAKTVKMKLFPYLIKIGYAPYKNRHGGKMRPVLMHQIDNNFVKVWSITKEYLTKSSFIRMQYFPLFKWHPYGLNRTSYVDIKSGVRIPYKVYKELNLCKRDPIWYLDHEDINSFIDFNNSYHKRVSNWRNKN